MKKKISILINLGLLICCLSVDDANQKQNKIYNLSELFKNNKKIFQGKCGNSYSLINQDGNMLIERYYSTSVVYKEIQQILNKPLLETRLKDSGLTKIEVNDKIGFVDQNGKIVVPPKYDVPGIYEIAHHSDFFDLNEGMIGVKYKDKWGFIDITGKEVISCKYDYAESFSEGMAVVLRNGWTIINKKGEEIELSGNYSRIAPFVDGMAQVISNCGISYGYHENDNFTKPAKCGYIDTSGKEVIPLKYNYVCYYDGYSLGDTPFSEGLVLVELNKKFGFINKKGEKITQIHFENAYSFLNGVAVVQLNEKWGVINNEGKVIIPLKYDSIITGDYANSLYGVEVDKKWGFIDETGRQIISLKYNEAGPFSNGTAKVCLNGKCGLVDAKAKEITPLKYDDVQSFSFWIKIVTLNNKYGLINRDGKEITLIKYDEIQYLQDDLLKIRDSDKWGIINERGEEIIPFKYEKIIQIK